MTISIVLADDHPVVRHGLRSLLASEADFTIAGEAEDGLETLRLVERLQPSVLVLDLMLPGLSGLDVLPVVRQRCPRTRVVVFSVTGAEGIVLQALRGGALGYVLKGSQPSNLVTSVRQAAAGQPYLCPEIMEVAVASFFAKAASATPPDPHDRLTPRERQALQLTAEGHSCPEIAERLTISPRTAEMHRGSAMRKLGLKSQADLARYAVRRGMIPPGT
jgi:two-component system response regulator NreC